MTVGPEMASINKIAVLAVVFYLIFLMPFVFSSSSKTHQHRRILHQPFFPIEALPPTTQPPLPPPPHHQQQPKYPFSTLLPPANQNPFFPFYPSPSPPPPPTSLATIPANISSLSLPGTSSSSSKPISRKLVAIAVSLALFSAALITAIAAFLLLRHRTNPQKAPGSEGVRLFPPNTASSDRGHKPPPLLSPSGNISGRSSEFLHIGTLKGIADDSQKYVHSANASGSSMTGYQRLGSPELHPLPPLPRHFSPQKNPNPEVFSNEYDRGGGGEEEEFFSPRASSNGSPNGPDSSPRKVFIVENFRSKSLNSRNNSYPSSISGSTTNSISSSPFIALNFSPRSINSNSPDSIINFPARPSQPTAAESPPRNRNPEQTQNSPSENQQFSSKTEPASSQHIPFPVKSPPPPPPPPPPRFWEVLVTPSRETSVDQLLSLESVEKNYESSKPKLKPLHWDKVRASSDRAMVWDQLKSSSFQLNEEMIETLFMVNGSGSGAKDNSRRVGQSMLNQQYRVLDPKKSQNIAILLRALNVTIDEVCESLLEGSADTLGTELLESLLKMAPTREEEHKLKEFKDESPLKLGPAEKFLKAVLDIPFAFQRVHAMLYMANFDSDVEYLKRSFETLKAACEELKNSRMFFKLLEAVLKTGNRMNVGTNRGDALAFKLDTLLKLVDVKGTDGKTTLLHFVVQEISRAEGSHLASTNQSSTSFQSPECSLQDDIEFRKIGLQIVSGLSGELTNVKKAADLDSDVLSNEVAKLARGIAKIQEVLKLNEEVVVKEKVPKFSESMNKFLNRAEGEIVRVQNLESGAFCLVREVTEYFHGNSAKEEAHPFRIFTVVRDFISILDQVCKEVGKVNERSIISSTRQFPLPVNTSLPRPPPVFPGFSRRNQDNSSDDESSS